MPKLFPINIEVEEAVVGKVYRMLDGLAGVAKIKIGDSSGHGKTNGAGEPRGPYKVRKPAVHLEETGEEAVANALFKKSPQETAVLRGLFAEQGRSAASISSVLHSMKTKGDIVNTSDGYALSKKARDRLRHRIANRKTRR